MKPFRDNVLLSAIGNALERSKALHDREAETHHLQQCYASLTPRERQVMALVVAGLLDKQVGGELGISEITVKAHRGKAVSAILTDAAPSLKQFDPTIPAELDQAVKRCLNKEPDQRFQSAGDLAFHLRQVLNTVPSTSATTQVGRQAARFSRRSARAAAITVAAFLFLGAFALWIGTKRSSVVRPQFKSIAVLPLQNYSGDPQQDYFVDGMTDSVIADLGKIKDIRVISRTSVMPYKTSKKSMREIASELHADAVIEGSVMRSADRVRLTVQLIDAARDQHLWSESYERELTNVFALPGQVAQAIAQQVHAVVTPEEQERLAKKRAIDPDVYELYLKGRHIMERGGLKDVQKAIDYFQSGLARDPDNALLYTGLADAYIDNDGCARKPELPLKRRCNWMTRLQRRTPR